MFQRLGFSPQNKSSSEELASSGRLEGCAARKSLSSAPHPLQHLLDMGDRCLRLDAVAEIEDEPPLRKIRQRVVDRAVERGAACDQHQRIEIALNRNLALHALADEGRLRGPVAADRVDTGRLDETG